MQFSANSRYSYWLADPDLDAAMRRELELMQDPEAVADHFARSLFVGMGGLTARLGAGTSYLNAYTFGAVARACALHAGETGAARVLIGRDGRDTSPAFSRQLCRAFAAEKIPCALIEEEIAAPVFSFAVRQGRYDFGFYVSATHHGSACNGLLAYDAHGCLLLPEEMKKLDEHLQNLDPLQSDTSDALETALSCGAVSVDKTDYFSEFARRVTEQMGAETSDCAIGVLCVSHVADEGETLKKMLSAFGFSNVEVVPGTGETLDMPYHRDGAVSPTAREAFEQSAAQILICTDSSLNNISAAVKHDGEIFPFTGSEIGILLLDGRCRRLLAEHKLPEHPVAAVSLIVSPMLHRVAERYGIQVTDTLIGFRHIVRVIESLAQSGREEDFVVGFEDNGSVLLNTVTRDKDALSTAAALCELARREATGGRTLFDAMESLSKTYGHFAYSRDQFSFEGMSGATRMYNLLRLLCHDIPTDIGGMRVLTLRDYDRRTAFDLSTLQTTTLPTDSAQIVALDLEAGTIVLRPASNKPLLRVYFAAHDERPEAAEEKMAAMRRAMRTWIVQRT